MITPALAQTSMKTGHASKVRAGPFRLFYRDHLIRSAIIPTETAYLFAQL